MRILLHQDLKDLDKPIIRFQKLISQFEIHGKVISQEDANLKLLRSLPLAWNNIALIMRNKYDLNTLSMDDLYNNIKVYKYEIKVQSSSSSNSQNVAFVSLENTSSINEAVNTAHEVSTASSQGQASSSTYADDIWSRLNTDDLEEIDLKWQVAMLTMRGYNCCHKERLLTVASELHGTKESGNHKRNYSKKECTSGYIYHKCLGCSRWDSAKNKTGLGYDSQINKSEVVHSVFSSRESDVDDSPVNDRFKTGEGFHAVPPPYIRNYMPSRPDLSFARLDDSVYKTKVSETETSISKTSKDIVEKPKTVRPSAPIIEE
ncbi:hypothetical protein Tco_0846256 [Tanacetum coccineum]